MSAEIIKVPDIGGDSATVIEVCVKPGDSIKKDDSIIVLESDKASMEVPSPKDGVISEILVKLDDNLSEGAPMVKLELVETTQATTEKPSDTATTETKQQDVSVPVTKETSTQVAAVADTTTSETKYHAGPAVRKLARELDISLSAIQGTGSNNRIVKEDLHNYIKSRMNQAGASGVGIPPVAQPDFSKWGDITTENQSRAQQIAATNFQTSWLNVPHVTQFDQADITELEKFRKAMKKPAEAQGVKLTPLAFIIKACAHVILAMPEFASSLAAGNKQVFKQYINIGIAVDTPHGLFVPVIKNADKLGIYQIAKQCVELATKAKEKKLKPNEMQGGCFTISSLGAIGGTAFTPIVNAPEVAILGLSKAAMQPVWNGNEFVARLMLPLSLSYDHRVINGVQAAKFTATLSNYIADIRNLLL